MILVIDLEATCDDGNVKPIPPDEMEIIEIGAVWATAEGMVKALELAGLPLTGDHHRGIDDARNIAMLLPFV
ncbi:hypothetical protein AGMMS49960_14700 [Betaproteobacteria bacterium]|nr:hypothetical protein AGMMS49543_20030 [Betaproteobacteria bacterium]GHU02436.1 hypothetical protein AGMMS49960_14700 [Betaproteobacteria bacterium]GHU22082.1 hypothetical protein AGMMS50243_20970 [Betaproteobacteria bacterium]